MLKRLRAWARRLAWGDPAAENERLAAEVAALNHSLARLYQEYQNESQGKRALLGALTLQAGGRIVMPSVFLETVLRGGYRLASGGNEAGDVVITVTRGEEGGDARE